MGFWDRLTTRLFTRTWVCEWEDTDPFEKLRSGGTSGRTLVEARSFFEAKAKAEAEARPHCKGTPMLTVRRAFHWETGVKHETPPQ